MQQKILVINLMHIGDLLLVTPVLRTLRTNYPQAHIALLADAKLADLVKYNENIDELIVIDKKGYHDRLLNYLRFTWQIRQRKFDWVINLHANERASFIAAMSGAERIVGYATAGLNYFFHQTIENRKAVKHQIHSHFDVLQETLGIQKIDDRGLEMWLDTAAEQTAETLWQAAFSQDHSSLNLTVIGLNVGASWPTKRWRKEYFAQVADDLLNRGYGVAFFGGPMDVTMVDETLALMQEADHPNLKIFTGKMTLLELAALLKKCAAFITNDSGPMHVAVAMGVPLISMFGPSPVPGFYPYHTRSVVLKSSVPCHPCGKHQCPTQHECMWQIKPELVLKHTLDQLENQTKYALGSYIEPDRDDVR